MILKKMGRVILAVVIAVSAMAVPAFAVSEASSITDDWDGTADTSWYTSSGTVFNLDSAEDLAGLASLVNSGTNFTGKTVNLTVNVRLNTTAATGVTSGQREWTPIGGAAAGYSFKGTFDGNDNTISNIYYNHTDGSYSKGNSVRNNIGLFGKVEEGATVKNVKLVGGYVAAQRSVGSVAGKSWGTVDNCTSSVIVYGTETKGTGGLVGANWVNTASNPPVIKNCSYSGTVTSTSSNGSVGGIAGENEGAIYNCYNTGAVNGSYNVGGIVGSNQNNINQNSGTLVYGSVANCYNTGTIAGGTYAGGIAGYCNYSVQNCYNIGTVTGTNAGAIIGQLTGSGNVVSVYYLTGTSAVATGATSGTLSVSPIVRKSDLKESLNLWIQSGSVYSTWTTSSNVNNGYPYFA